MQRRQHISLFFVDKQYDVGEYKSSELCRDDVRVTRNDHADNNKHRLQVKHLLRFQLSRLVRPVVRQQRGGTIAYGSALCSCAGTATATSATLTATGLAALPSCGQVCFNNMLAQYGLLGCAYEQNAAYLCENVNFGYGLRDCSNGACGTTVASTVIDFGSSYCASATATVSARRL